MRSLVFLLSASLLLLGSESSTLARSKGSPPPPAPTLIVPESPPPGTVQAEPPPDGFAAPALAAPPTLLMPPPVALAPPTRRRKYWQLSAVGGIVLGGVYVTSILVGSLSYAGFYQGQWGWFVPLVGPALVMGNVGGQVCSCTLNQIYTYSIGPLLSLATVGAIVPIILGGILNKTVPVTQTSKLQLIPKLDHDSTGFQLVGRF